MTPTPNIDVVAVEEDAKKPEDVLIKLGDYKKFLEMQERKKEQMTRLFGSDDGVEVNENNEAQIKTNTVKQKQNEAASKSEVKANKQKTIEIKHKQFDSERRNSNESFERHKHKHTEITSKSKTPTSERKSTETVERKSKTNSGERKKSTEIKENSKHNKNKQNELGDKNKTNCERNKIETKLKQTEIVERNKNLEIDGEHNKSKISSTKHKHKHSRSEEDELKKHKKQRTHEKKVETKRKPVLSLQKIDDNVVPMKKQKQIITDETIDYYFPTAVEIDSSTITLENDVNIEKLLSVDNNHIKIHQGEVNEVVFETTEERQECAMNVLPMVEKQVKIMEHPALPTATVIEKPIVLQEIIDLTTVVKSEDEDDDDDNKKSTLNQQQKENSFARLRMLNSSFALNIVSVVLPALIDRHIYRIATKMCSVHSTSEIDHEMEPYKLLLKNKMQITCKRFLDRLSVIEDVPDFNVMELLKETANYMRTQLTNLKLTYTLPMIFEMLYAIIRTIDNKKKTPFIEKFITEMEKQKEIMIAAKGRCFFFFYY